MQKKILLIIMIFLIFIVYLLKVYGINHLIVIMQRLLNLLF